MYIRKKNRVRLIILVIIVLGFIYWRGTNALIKGKGLNCTYHLVYAYCTGKNVKVPGIIDVFKAGIKF